MARVSKLNLLLLIRKRRKAVEGTSLGGCEYNSVASNQDCLKFDDINL